MWCILVGIGNVILGLLMVAVVGWILWKIVTYGDKPGDGDIWH